MHLEIRNVSKVYDGKTVLSGIQCDFEAGIYGLLGPNGAGKSTLMNIISDNILPEQGEVLYDGKRICDLGREFRKKLGYMPQQQRMYQGFSVIRFLYYMGTLRGMSKKDIVERSESVLNQVNMWEHKAKKLGELSGGMRQRVLLAQTILDNPEILLLDEPTAGLDPEERIRIRNLISKISLNRIVLYSTHVVSDIEFIADRILCLKQGEMIAWKETVELYKDLEGRVFQVELDEEELKSLPPDCIVSGMTKTKEKKLQVRIITDNPLEGIKCMLVSANLEDVYLALFRGEKE